MPKRKIILSLIMFLFFAYFAIVPLSHRWVIFLSIFPFLLPLIKGVKDKIIRYLLFLILGVVYSGGSWFLIQNESLLTMMTWGALILLSILHLLWIPFSPAPAWSSRLGALSCYIVALIDLPPFLYFLCISLSFLFPIAQKMENRYLPFWGILYFIFAGYWYLSISPVLLLLYGLIGIFNLISHNNSRG